MEKKAHIGAMFQRIGLDVSRAASRFNPFPNLAWSETMV